MGVAFGSVLGLGFRHLMKFCERKDLIDRQSYVAQYVSLALFTIGVIILLGSDDLLVAFSCGIAFAWDGFFNSQTEQSVFSSHSITLSKIQEIWEGLEFSTQADNKVQTDVLRGMVMKLSKRVMNDDDVHLTSHRKMYPHQ